MIDSQGFRPNVGIFLVNDCQQLIWARRKGTAIWQCPQGGVYHGENLTDAMYRELYEELGLSSEHVQLIGRTQEWLPYRFPEPRTYGPDGRDYVGQKQIWFLLNLVASDTCVCLDKSGEPEFDAWRWVDYWYPLTHIVAFKQPVYQSALQELAPFVANLSPQSE